MSKRRAAIVVYILTIWFVISFVTNIIGPLMPTIIADFRLNLALAGFLPFSFFLAYGIVSIPAGIAIERYGAKRALLGAFTLNLAGALAIALFPNYAMVIGALFIIGLGMAMLQVVINPLMRTAGGDVHFAFYSVMGQLVFGLASFLSPLAFSALMQRASDASAHEGMSAALLQLSPAALPWVSFYWAFSAIFVALIALTSAIDIPTVELADDERAGTRATYVKLFADRHVRLYFLAMVAYVGTEQTLANWMSQFLDTYHQVFPIVGGAHAVALFWGLMSVGCVLGLLLLKIVDSKVVLSIFSVLAMLCVAAALFGPADVALLAFPVSGFFLSVMYSVIFSLALNSVSHHHGALSGILCTGILGGAILPLLVGFLGDRLGLRAAMTLVFLTIAYIFSIGIWARPLVRNETVDVMRLFGFSKKTASP